jgi:RNA polymerase-interacting CarD/CdnL/TRCF family regulator
MKNKKFKVGDKVIYHPRDGKPCRGVITGIGEKNEMKVYDVDLPDGDMRWGYADQFEPIK